MLDKIINLDFIKVQQECKDWKEAIFKGAKILEDKNLVEKRYKTEIINKFKEFGCYMVIAPGIVLSHARPKDGVIKTGISIITLKQPINFGHSDNDPVKLVVTLAAEDNNNHVDVLASLMNVFLNPEALNTIFNAKSNKDIYEIIKNNNL